MDNAHKSTRLFPAYTLKELKASVAVGITNICPQEVWDKMVLEIEARESGKSVAFKTPQVRRLTDEQYRRQQYDDQYDAEIRAGV